MALVRHLRLASRLSSPRQFLHLRAMSNNGPVFEMRIYELKPDGFKSFLELIEKYWHVRTADSKCLGFWMTDLGGINEVIHIWQYDSISDRALRRKKLSENQAWQKEFLPKFFSLAFKMTNVLLSVSPGFKLETSFTPSPSALYELHICEGGSTKQCLSNEFLVGRFTGVYGPTNTEYLLFRYTDANIALSQAVQRNQGQNARGYSRLMLPSTWSPMK